MAQKSLKVACAGLELLASGGLIVGGSSFRVSMVCASGVTQRMEFVARVRGASSVAEVR